MYEDIESFLTNLGRPALVGEECDDEKLLCRQGPPLRASNEAWPESGGNPLVPILSIYVAELPYTPDFLKAATYWSFFIAGHCWETWTGDGTLVVRRYTDVTNLRQVPGPAGVKPKPMPLRFREVRDHPCDEAIEEELSNSPQLLAAYQSRSDEFRERFPCHSGIKLGGYPLLIQPTAFLMCLDPDFAIQIDISDYFHYGDSGIGYFTNDLSYACWETL